MKKLDDKFMEDVSIQELVDIGDESHAYKNWLIVYQKKNAKLA